MTATTTRAADGTGPVTGEAESRAEPVFTSPWTLRERVLRQLWSIVQGTVFRFSLYNAFRWRRWLLRLFGANLAKDVRIRPSARVEIPWNLTIGENSSVGDFAILYCLGPVRIGRRVTVSQYAHLCAGTHETNTRRMRLLRPPIEIGDEAWIAADVYVGPGVTIGARTIVGARSNVYKNLPSDVIAVGSPARAVKDRVFLSEAQEAALGDRVAPGNYGAANAREGALGS